VREDDAVDDLTGDQRDRGLRHAAEQRRADREQDIAAVPEHVAREAPDPTRLRRGLSQWDSGCFDPLTMFR